MIIDLSIGIAIFFLIVLSIIDLNTFNLKKGYIPAALTTLFIITEFIFVGGLIAVVGGVFTLLIGMLLTDLNLFHGVADLKVLVAIGISLKAILLISTFAAIMILTGILYQIIIKETINRKVKKIKYIPFIPAMLIAYLATIWLF